MELQSMIFTRELLRMEMEKLYKTLSFRPEVIFHALMPTLKELFRLYPESLPFRYPVDALQVPDYYEIIKNPIDLSTIKFKLQMGLYQDPWQYIDDMYLMFDNAELYNKKTSKVYKYCSKLSEVFRSVIDQPMQSLGYCCGQRYAFEAQVLYCTQACSIPVGAIYWEDNNGIKYCQKCFSKISEDCTLGDNSVDPLANSLKAKQFQQRKNNSLKPEPFIHCKNCNRKQHEICVLYMEIMWPEGFLCNTCLKIKGKRRRENKFTAEKLQKTELGLYLENHVNSYLEKMNCGAFRVIIRVLSSSEKSVEVKPEMKSKFFETEEQPLLFPYRAKAIFAFQRINATDVCFFGMYVQEYGSECPFPNTRRVYIAYLDSVHFFQPKQHKTAVYHEILLGYLSYSKHLGYIMAHIWASPPSEGDDYIFNCHPPEQKIPKPGRLHEWYKILIDKGIKDGIILDYKDIFMQALEDNLKSVSELPYFDGDYWPDVLEHIIKELANEERKAKACVVASSKLNMVREDDMQPQKKRRKSGCSKMLNKSKCSHRKSNKFDVMFPGNSLSAKLYSTMEKFRKAFYVIRLHSTETAEKLPPVMDPDPLISCDLMDSRDVFLTFTRENNYEFSSLRRAKFSTMGLLCELRTQGQDSSLFVCNKCHKYIEERYHCHICDDFDLCISCYGKEGHNHEMEKVGCRIDHDSEASDSKQASLVDSRNLFIQYGTHFMVHACECRDANCPMQQCRVMKLAIQHASSCVKRASCNLCKKLLVFRVQHSKNCQETRCVIPGCSMIKHKLHLHRPLISALNQQA